MDVMHGAYFDGGRGDMSGGSSARGRISPAGARPGQHLAPARSGGVAGIASSGGMDSQGRATILEEVRELIRAETRERLELQRAVRTDLQAQQDSVRRLATTLEDSLAVLRRDVPALQEELAMQKRDFEAQSEELQRGQARAESLERGLAEESEARYDAERAQGSDLHQLRDLFSAELGQAHGSIAEVRDSLSQLLSQLSLSGQPPAEAMDSHAGEDGHRPGAGPPLLSHHNENDGNEDALIGTMCSDGEVRIDAEELMRQTLERMEARLQESRGDSGNQLQELDQKITEEWTGLRGWVDAAVVAVVNRMSSLECALQSELADRSVRMEEITDSLAQSKEEWGQLQLDVDDLRASQEESEAKLLTFLVQRPESPRGLTLSAGYAGAAWGADAAAACLYTPPGAQLGPADLSASVGAAAGRTGCCAAPCRQDVAGCDGRGDCSGRGDGSGHYGGYPSALHSTSPRQSMHLPRHVPQVAAPPRQPASAADARGDPLLRSVPRMGPGPLIAAQCPWPTSAPGVPDARSNPGSRAVSPQAQRDSWFPQVAAQQGQQVIHVAARRM